VQQVQGRKSHQPNWERDEIFALIKAKKEKVGKP